MHKVLYFINKVLKFYVRKKRPRTVDRLKFTEKGPRSCFLKISMVPKDGPDEHHHITYADRLPANNICTANCANIARKLCEEMLEKGVKEMLEKWVDS